MSRHGSRHDGSVRCSAGYAKGRNRPPYEQARAAHATVVAVSLTCAAREGCLPRSLATVLLCRLHGQLADLVGRYAAAAAVRRARLGRGRRLDGWRGLPAGLLPSAFTVSMTGDRHGDLRRDAGRSPARPPAAQAPLAAAARRTCGRTAGTLLAGGLLALRRRPGRPGPAAARQARSWTASATSARAGPVRAARPSHCSGRRCSTRAATYLLGRAAESVVLTARQGWTSHLLRLPVGAVDRLKPGDLLSRVTSDTTLLRTVTHLRACPVGERRRSSWSRRSC